MGNRCTSLKRIKRTAEEDTDGGWRLGSIVIVTDPIYPQFENDFYLAEKIQIADFYISEINKIKWFYLSNITVSGVSLIGTLNTESKYYKWIKTPCFSMEIKTNTTSMISMILSQSEKIPNFICYHPKLIQNIFKISKQQLHYCSCKVAQNFYTQIKGETNEFIKITGDDCSVLIFYLTPPEQEENQWGDMKNQYQVLRCLATRLWPENDKKEKIALFKTVVNVICGNMYYPLRTVPNGRFYHFGVKKKSILFFGHIRKYILQRVVQLGERWMLF